MQRTQNYNNAVEYITSILNTPRYVVPSEIETTIKALREHIDSIDSCQSDRADHDEVDAGEAALLRQYLHNELTTRHMISDNNNIETHEEPTMSYNTSELHAIAHEIEAEITRHTAAMQVLMLRQRNAIAKLNATPEQAPAEQAKPSVDDAKETKPRAARVKKQDSLKDLFNKVDEITSKPLYAGEATPDDSIEAAPARIEPLTEEQPNEVSVSRVKSKKAKTDKTGREAAPKGKTNTTTTTHDGKTYAELRSIISAATKSSSKAKDIAKQVAAELGQKSWAATGWAGYAKIYDAIK